jgi:PIN domain nuclease of toxin-antitoxin system
VTVNYSRHVGSDPRFHVAESATLARLDQLDQLGLRHTQRLAALPPHHADPFDRMLIAQALAEGATIVSHDRALEPYGVPVLWT